MMLKRKGRFSKFMVSFVIALNIIFAAAVLYIVANGGVEPSTLVGCWFAFTTGELFFLSSIKKKKVEEEKKHD
jgi:hypothetical protein